MDYHVAKPLHDRIVAERTNVEKRVKAAVSALEAVLSSRCDELEASIAFSRAGGSIHHPNTKIHIRELAALRERQKRGVPRKAVLRALRVGAAASLGFDFELRGLWQL